MKDELSSLDIKILVSELQNLVGARMQKFYQKGREIHILLHVPRNGTHTLVLGSGKLFLTKKRFEYPPTPSAFAMTLRKYTGGKKIIGVNQHGFDRVVVIETESHKIIAELFRNGNIVLTDPDYKIWSLLEKQAWSDRTTKIKEKYVFPKHSEMAETLAKITESDKQAVVFLASSLSFGGEYAEEILFRAKVEKAKKCSALVESEISAISKEIKKTLGQKIEPYNVYEEKEITGFAPFDMSRYKSYEKAHKKTYNEAVADYFSKEMHMAKEQTANKEGKKQVDRFKARMQQQVLALDRIEKEAEQYKEMGDLIYSNFDRFNNAVSQKEKHKMNRKDRTLTLEFEGKKVVLFYNEPLSKSAQNYYDMSKRLKAKIERLKIEIEKTKKEMHEHKESVERKRAAPKNLKKEWYHKYRWFHTSGGFLCVCGKDADTNEELIKKRTEKTDLVIHADITGSPFGLLKTRGKQADEKSIKEALEFVASYSRAWQAGVGVVEAYWVLPDQVTKKTPAGEYISKGSFMVYGKKNLFKTELKLAIGFVNGMAAAGAVSSLPKPFIVIKPGRMEAKELSKEIKAHLTESSPKDLKPRAEKLALDEIARLIPFGKGAIIK